MRIAATALAGMLGICVASTAEAQQIRQPQTQSYTYLFGEYDHYAFSHGDGSLDGGGLGAGWRISRFLAIQGGGQYSRKSGIDLTNLYGEVLGILPLGRRISLYGSYGLAYATASTKISGVTISISRSGYRAGFGLDYWLAKDWALQLAFHRQNAGGVGDDLGIGVAYKF